jgi:hypothetical protein
MLIISFFYIIVGVNFFKQNVMFRLMDKSTKAKFLPTKTGGIFLRRTLKAKTELKPAT